MPNEHHPTHFIRVVRTKNTLPRIDCHYDHVWNVNIARNYACSTEGPWTHADAYTNTHTHERIARVCAGGGGVAMWVTLRNKLLVGTWQELISLIMQSSIVPAASDMFVSRFKLNNIRNKGFRCSAKRFIDLRIACPYFFGGTNCWGDLHVIDVF